MNKLAMLVCVVAAMGGCKEKVEEPPPVARGGGPINAPEPPPAKPKSFEETVLDAPTLAQAIEFARPDVKAFSGQDAVSGWAARHLKWSDVFAAEPETNFAQALGDEKAALGKRMCPSGTITEMRKGHTADVRVGMLDMGGPVVFRFYAVGSSDGLAVGEWAGFCGAVLGDYVYEDKAGRMMRALSLVGMFDLPENKPPPASKPAAPSKKTK